MKHNEFKYLTVSDDDQQWGLYLKVAGSANISAGYQYPSHEHPSEYFFYWDDGRILNEFQINFISEGTGILENSFGTFPLKQGSIFITFPGIWHRYKPNIKTGWTEEAGENLMTLVERAGHRLIIVVLRSTDRFGETEKLINWVFGNYQWKEFVPSIQPTQN